LIYPNPSKEEINLSKNIQGEYKIYSLKGGLVSEGNLTQNINISHLKQGAYFLKVFDKNSKEYSLIKIIKQ
tara:strand:- start:1134 stop:1346 length:213 start_codon:yes stop_codon:yes gene_type:complete